MAGLREDRNTPMKDGTLIPVPVAGEAVISAGALVVANTEGYAEAGKGANTLTFLGRAEERVDNTGGGNGDQTVWVRRKQAFRWGNSSSDAVTQAELGQTCWIEDDQTVSQSSDGGARSPAGVVIGVESDGVWVDAPEPSIPPRVLTATKTLDFPEVAAGGKQDLTLTVTGAAAGDAVALGLPKTLDAGLIAQAFVSAANTVTVRLENPTASAIDPASAPFRVTVLKS